MARTIGYSFGYGMVERTADVPPMSEMNTTPLIDVMLVLLIMFIVTVPMQTYIVEQRLPGGPPPEFTILLKNELHMDRSGALTWNNRPVSDGQLALLLGDVAGRTDQPEVHFRPDGQARYERVDEVLAIAAKSGATSFGFVGNEKYDRVF